MGHPVLETTKLPLNFSFINCLPALLSRVTVAKFSLIYVAAEADSPGK